MKCPRRIRKLALTLLTAATATAGLCLAQQPRSTFAFEVASIRPGAEPDAEMIPIRMNAERSRIHYVNVSLKDCILKAYHVKGFQIIGPEWMSERFNIEATYPPGATEERVPEMLQALLRDRFGLQVHREMKEHSVLALVVDRSGLKLKETAVHPEDYPDGPRRKPGTPVFGDIQIMGSPSGMRLKGPGATMASLIEKLSIFTDKPVIDQTGLGGRYDIDLQFIAENKPFTGPDGPGARPGGGPDAPAESHASLFEALQQNGLKLESRKAPLMTLVIDHLEKKPTEN